MNIVFVACCKQKNTGKMAARDLYASNLFKKSMAYAELIPNAKIYILSAEHHLLDVDSEIENYDITLNNLGVNKRRAWATKVIKSINEKTDPMHDKYVFLTGKSNYEFIVNELLHERVVLPLKGKKIGERLQYLTNQLQGEFDDKLFL